MNPQRSTGLILASAFIITVFTYTQSLSGFVTLGVLPALWFDKVLVRLLPWRDPQNVLRDVKSRTMFFTVGCAIAWLLAREESLFFEVLWIGLVVSLLAFGLECLFGVMVHGFGWLESHIGSR